MIFRAKKIELRDGTICILRNPEEHDAEKMIEYLKIISEETYYLTRYPEEINISIDKEIEILRGNQNSNTDMMILAFVNNELAGNVVIRCERNHIKLKHRAVLGISVKKKYWNKGIGNELLREIIEQARVIGYV